MGVPWSKSGDPDTSSSNHAGSFSLHYPGVSKRGDKRLLGDNKYQNDIYRDATAREEWKGVKGVIREGNNGRRCAAHCGK
ncbi:hypothetical protein TUM20903_20410 [Citrobacter koseri]|nr:hypothetical protein TUM20903_20410 [Citrobacter koseri]